MKVATLRPTFLFVQQLCGFIFLFLRRTTSLPHSDNNFVELDERFRFSFVGQGLQDPGRETIWPDRLAFRQRTERPCYLVPRRDIVQRRARGRRLFNLVYKGEIGGRRHDGVKAVCENTSSNVPG